MFTIKAKVAGLGEPQEVGRNNNTKQDLILEYGSQYPKKLVVSFWGDAIESIKSLSEGDDVEVEFRAESREYNGRWFTNCNGKSATTLGQGDDAPELSPPGDVEDADVSPF
jgi:hypothetical protein